MEIKSRQHDDILILDMAGRLDTSTSGNAHDALVGYSKSGAKRILLNLDKLEYVSSAGLRVFLTLARLLQSAGGEMKIGHANGVVRDALESFQFNSLIKIFDDETSAIKSWN